MMTYFKTAASAFIQQRMTEPLLHGDDKHKVWLKEELMKWVPDLANEFEMWFELGREVD